MRGAGGRRRRSPSSTPIRAPASPTGGLASTCSLDARPNPLMVLQPRAAGVARTLDACRLCCCDPILISLCQADRSMGGGRGRGQQILRSKAARPRRPTTGPPLFASPAHTQLMDISRSRTSSCIRGHAVVGGGSSWKGAPIVWFGAGPGSWRACDRQQGGDGRAGVASSAEVAARFVKEPRADGLLVPFPSLSPSIPVDTLVCLTSSRTSPLRHGLPSPFRSPTRRLPPLHALPPQHALPPDPPTHHPSRPSPHLPAMCSSADCSHKASPVAASASQEQTLSRILEAMQLLTESNQALKAQVRPGPSRSERGSRGLHLPLPPTDPPSSPTSHPILSGRRALFQAGGQHRRS